MRDDWVFVDYLRIFVPGWLSKMLSLKVFSAVVLALTVLVVALKMGRTIG